MPDREPFTFAFVVFRRYRPQSTRLWLLLLPRPACYLGHIVAVTVNVFLVVDELVADSLFNKPAR
jgi:hypothetical protein